MPAPPPPQSGHTHGDILAIIESYKGERRPVFVFQQVFSVSIHCQSSPNSQDQSCKNRSVFTLCCSLVWLSTKTTTEDVWTCWLPWKQGLVKGCCCVDGVHRKNRGGQLALVCGIDPVPFCTGGRLCSVEFHARGRTRRQWSVILSPKPVWNPLSVCLPDSKQAASERNVCLWFRP